MAAFVVFGIAVLVWLALLIFFRHYRIWLMFYMVGSVGLAFLLIVAGTRLAPWERWLEVGAAYGVHAICQLLHIPTRVFEAAPGNILVWVVVQEPGWTVVRIDLECSGLLEMAVLSGLLLFYPAWSAFKRAWLVLLGLLATGVANVVRVLSIILILHTVGKRSIFVAHTIAGRLIFFALVAGLYWWVLTRGTLRVLDRQLQSRMKA